MGRKENKETIHSGHFMVSDVDAIETLDEEQEEFLDVMPDNDSAESKPDNNSANEKSAKKVKVKQNNIIQYKSAASKNEAISIDGSLTKLFNAMDIAYK